jgi:hypothetical protein
MVSVPMWYNGLCFSVVYWFLFFGGVLVSVPRWCNGLCFLVV